ncbi:contractile injection system protein, VgrG/Pvc8 family [Fundidesulfovibrio butyratiphilus]
MEAVAVRAPQWVIVIGGKDISSSITDYVLSVTYTDHIKDASDELDLTLCDPSGVWRSGWYPVQGMRLSASMGYRGEGLAPCGDFEIEEIELAGPPDTMHIRALASGIKQAQRTKRSQAYEGTTLAGIARSVAERHGYSLVGDIADVALARVTQNQEPDLGFLKRLAGDYGYVFSVKGDRLVFSKYSKLRAATPVLTLNRAGGVASYSLRDKSLAAYKACECSYHDPKTKTCHTHTAGAKGVATADTRKITRRCENAQQAKLQSEAELEKQNDAKFEGTITTEGDPRLLAGNTVSLAGFGRFDGVWLIDSSRHSMDRSSGYATEITIKRGYEEADDAA